MPSPIVVGLDGSEESAVAARWAVAEGALRGCPVVALVAWSFLDQVYAHGTAPFDPHYREDDAASALDSWLVDALGVGAASQVERRVVCDLPAQALAEAGSGSTMLVVGARGAGGFAGLRLGSVADGVIRRSLIPTIVVRDTDRAGRVVVGVDGSEGSEQALHWAAAAARLRGVQLELVHTWQPSVFVNWAVFPDAGMFEGLRRESERIVAHAAESVAATVGDVIMTSIDGSAAQQLVDAATSASLVVVGTRGLGNVVGAALGSVSRQVIYHATCPVATIPTVGTIPTTP